MNDKPDLPHRPSENDLLRNTWKNIAKGQDFQSPLPGTLSTWPFGLYHHLHVSAWRVLDNTPSCYVQGRDPTPNSCTSASDSYSPSRPRPFWQRPQCTNTQTLRAQAMSADHQEFNFTIFPAAVAPMSHSHGKSASGSSAKSERSLGLKRYLVKMSATFLSKPIFFTTTKPSSILSCAHSVLLSRCSTFPNPFPVAIPFAAEESVDKVMLKSRPMSFAIPLIQGPRTCPWLLRSIRLHRSKAPPRSVSKPNSSTSHSRAWPDLHWWTSVCAGTQRSRCRRTPGGWTGHPANHNTCLLCFRKYLPNFQTLAQSDMHGLDIRLHLFAGEL